MKKCFVTALALVLLISCLPPHRFAEPVTIDFWHSFAREPTSNASKPSFSFNALHEGGTKWSALFRATTPTTCPS